MAKQTKPAETKQETSQFNAESKFSWKKLGANYIANYGESLRLARGGVSKEEGEKITKKIELYNKKPSEKLFNDIIKMLTPEAAKKKAELEKKEAATKGIKKQIKKEEKRAIVEKKEEKSFLDMLDDFLTSEPEAVEKFDAVLAKHRKVEEKKPIPVVAPEPQRRKGEY